MSRCLYLFVSRVLVDFIKITNLLPVPLVKILIVRRLHPHGKERLSSANVVPLPFEPLDKLKPEYLHFSQIFPVPTPRQHLARLWDLCRSRWIGGIFDVRRPVYGTILVV